MDERIVIIGGDAGGMSAVSQIRRLQPDAEVVALEKGNWTSYSACGIPFVIGGVVPGGIERLVARSPEQHRRNGIDVRMRSEAMAIDLAAGTVEVHDHEGSRTYPLGFDQLLIGTGGSPIRPPLPGIDLPFVRGVQTLDDAAALLEHAEQAGCKRVVVVGGGYIGLEMAEAFLHRGCSSTVIDTGRYPLGLLDPEPGAIVAAALTREGIDLKVGTKVEGFSPGAVHTDHGDVPADLVILGIGVGPNSMLAGAAGIELGVKEAIRVDERQATSVAGVWAAGDCAESTHLVSGEQVHIALGTYANRQSRVAGINIGGGDARTPRVLGTAVTKLCETEIALTGLNSKQAVAAGFDVVTSLVESSTAAGYYPDSAAVTVKLILERGSGRLLGAQIVGGPGAAKRIDTCATAITAGMDVQQVLDLDLAYAPPFSPLWDPVAVAAREALKLV
jgi:NADPH-dependent 2,4-dienoyl-CoA reductase/sulfur reductase-like enzyme